MQNVQHVLRWVEVAIGIPLPAVDYAAPVVPGGSERSPVGIDALKEEAFECWLSALLRVEKLFDSREVFDELRLIRRRQHDFGRELKRFEERDGDDS